MPRIHRQSLESPSFACTASSTSVATMQVPQEASDVRPQLELRFDEYKVTGGSIGYGRGGTTFAFTVGPLSDSTVAVLDSVAQKHGRICVYCCRQPAVARPRGARAQRAKQSARSWDASSTVLPLRSELWVGRSAPQRGQGFASAGPLAKYALVSSTCASVHTTFDPQRYPCLDAAIRTRRGSVRSTRLQSRRSTLPDL